MCYIGWLYCSLIKSVHFKTNALTPSKLTNRSKTRHVVSGGAHTGLQAIRLGLELPVFDEKHYSIIYTEQSLGIACVIPIVMPVDFSLAL